MERMAEPMKSREVSGPSGGGPLPSEIGATAARHGRELLERGFTVEQVVHEYGDVCQAITDLAVERDAAVTLEEFRTLNRCLDNAIADAVTEYSYQQASVLDDRQERVLAERLGAIAHELRNHVHTAMLAVLALKTGSVGLTGSTAAVLDRSLIGLRTLIDRSLSEVRISAGLPPQHHLLPLAGFMAEVESAATLEAQALDCILALAPVDPTLAILVDRDLLSSALGNLLQNAFKFSRPRSEVTVSAYASADRILIDVADRCGGLPPGSAKAIFRPFEQAAADRSGMGLGLSIALRSVEANQGTLRVRDVSGSGCVFTISLPRHRVQDGGSGANDPQPAGVE